MSQLIVKFPNGQSETYKLTEGVLLIGRRPPAQIILNKQNVSSRHAEIIVKNNQVHINDLKSVNGTFVNNQKITSRSLINDDEIVISDFRIIYKSDEKMRSNGSFKSLRINFSV